MKLVGNIGTPVLDEINPLPSGFPLSGEQKNGLDFVVIELSSYMLTTLKKQNFLSILGSLFPEHLDRHGGVEAYMKAKLNILEGSERSIVFSTTSSSINPPLSPLTKGGALCGKGTDYERNSDFFLVR